MYLCKLGLNLFTGSEEMHRNKATQTPAQTPMGYTPKPVCPPWIGGGDININLLIYVNLRSVHMTYLLITLLMEYNYL